MTAWTLRPARASDAAVIAAHRYYRREPQAERDAYASWVRGRIEAQMYLGWVAEAQGAIVGGAGAVQLDWGPTIGNPCPWRARIANVFVEPVYRGVGLARSLVVATIDTCLSLHPCTFNLAASDEGRRLYESLGFERYEGEMIRR